MDNELYGANRVIYPIGENEAAIQEGRDRGDSFHFVAFQSEARFQFIDQENKILIEFGPEEAENIVEYLSFYIKKCQA